MFEDAEILFAYTRQQAIEDGVLIDVTEMAREAGFRCAVALTSGVWAESVRVPEAVPWQDERGRLWDILTKLLFVIRRDSPATSELIFRVIARSISGFCLGSLSKRQAVPSYSPTITRRGV